MVRFLLEAVRPAAEAVLAALFPADCLVCARPLPWRQRGGVCLPCWDRLPWETGWRPVAGAPVVLYWAAPYQGPIRDLIHVLKFTGMDTVGGPLGDTLAVRLGPVLPPADLVTFVPLHRWRRFRRGFNQAEEIARAMGRRLGLPCEALLERHRIGRRQVGLGRRDRLSALQDCYRLRRRGRLPVPRRILLVDDVITTGATMEACARALLEGGAEAVHGCAVARTPEERPDPRVPAAGPLAAAGMVTDSACAGSVSARSAPDGRSTAPPGAAAGPRYR